MGVVLHDQQIHLGSNHLLCVCLFSVCTILAKFVPIQEPGYQSWGQWRSITKLWLRTRHHLAAENERKGVWRLVFPMQLKANQPWYFDTKTVAPWNLSEINLFSSLENSADLFTATIYRKFVMAYTNCNSGEIIKKKRYIKFFQAWICRLRLRKVLIEMML